MKIYYTSYVLLLLFNTIYIQKLVLKKPILYYYLCSFLCSFKEKNEKKERPVKSLFPRSLRVFRELQNSRAYCTLKQLQFFFRKILVLSGLFKGYMATDKSSFIVFDTFTN